MTLRTLALGLILTAGATASADGYYWNWSLSSGWFYDLNNYTHSTGGTPGQTIFDFDGPGATVDMSKEPGGNLAIADFRLSKTTVGAPSTWLFDFDSASTAHTPGSIAIAGGFSQSAYADHLTTTWHNAIVSVSGVASLVTSSGLNNTLNLDGGAADLAHPNWSGNGFYANGDNHGGSNNLNLSNGASMSLTGQMFGYANVGNTAFNLRVSSGSVLSADTLNGFTTATFEGGSATTLAAAIYTQASTQSLTVTDGATLKTPLLTVASSGIIAASLGGSITADSFDSFNTHVDISGVGTSLNSNNFYLTDTRYDAHGASSLTVFNQATVNGNLRLISQNEGTRFSLTGSTLNGGIEIASIGTNPTQVLIDSRSVVNSVAGSTIMGIGQLDIGGASVVNEAIWLKGGSANIREASIVTGHFGVESSVSGESSHGFLDGSSSLGGMSIVASGGSDADVVLDHSSSATGYISLFQDGLSTASLTVKGGSSIANYGGESINGSGTVVIEDGGSIASFIDLSAASVFVKDGGTLSGIYGMYAGSATVDVASGGALNGVNYFYDSSKLTTHDGSSVSGHVAFASPNADPAVGEFTGGSSEFQLATLSIGGFRFYPYSSYETGFASSANVTDGAIVRVANNNDFDVVSVFDGSTLSVAADSRVGIGYAAADPVATSGLEANTVTVFDGGWLYGSGTIGGVLENGSANQVTVVNAGGHIEPGNSPGTLHILGNYLQTSGTLDIEIGGLADYDQLDVTGQIEFTGGTIHILPYNGYVLPSDADFQLFTGFSSLIFSPNVDFTFDGGLTFKGFDPATGRLSVGAAAVPEPSPYAALGFGLLALLKRRRVATTKRR